MGGGAAVAQWWGAGWAGVMGVQVGSLHGRTGVGVHRHLQAGSLTRPVLANRTVDSNERSMIRITLGRCPQKILLENRKGVPAQCRPRPSLPGRSRGRKTGHFIFIMNDSTGRGELRLRSQTP